MKKNRHRRHSRKLRSNKRRSHRRSSRRSSLALRMNGLRGLRRNQIVTGIKNMVKPVALGAGGFLAARLLGSAAAKMDYLTKMLDKSDPVMAPNTKIVANIVGIVATIAVGGKIPYVKDNREAIVVGMGLALVDRLIAKAAWAPAMGETFYAAAGTGEYVNSPINGFGEYVNSPINGLGETFYAAAGIGGSRAAAAGTGEGDYPEGIDPADQDQIDGIMDVMEASAGVGDDVVLSPTMSKIGRAFGRKQFEYTGTPLDVMRPVTAEMDRNRPVTAGPITEEAIVGPTPGGRGYAGGVFAKNLFSGMAGG
jgi:hypothetical protein